MALEHIEPYPYFLNKPLDLVVNEQLVRTRITSSEWAEHWRPLLARIRDLFDEHLPKRFLMAIAGPPGCGKSILAEQFHWLIERGFFHREAHSIALPMDGFHLTNLYLEQHTRTLADGTTVPLSTYKGSPDTFDIKGLRQCLKALAARPEAVAWPGYSRVSHDPIPGKYYVHTQTNFIIVEGNYLLVDRGPFAGMPNLFDLRLYVESPGPRIISNLVERHIKGGKDLQEAKEWVKRIDLPNARIAESTKVNADVIVERDANEDLASVTWRGEAPTVKTKPDEPRKHEDSKPTGETHGEGGAKRE